MKSITAFFKIAMLFFGLSIFNTQAQSPDLFNYQGIARDNAGIALQNQAIGLQITIRQTTSTGTIVYQETHTPTTNQFGLFSIQVGAGAIVSGSMANINWISDLHFMQVEMDETGGTNYTSMGTRQFISVPYAKHASTVENDAVNDADADSTNELQNLALNQDTLFISNGNYIILQSFVDTDDQNLTLSNDTLYIEDGNFVVLNDSIFDGDSSTINELQALSISNDTLYLSNGGNVYLGGYNATDTTWKASGNNIYNTNTGNVGIGITTPAEPFHLHKNSSAYNWLLVTNNTTGTTNSDGFAVGLNSNEDVRIWNFEDTDIRFGTNGTERMVIQNTGEVEIDSLNTIQLTSGTLTINNQYTLPTTDGTNNQVLTTNGSGSVTWQPKSGNGIYDGSGTLSGNTFVTQGNNVLGFTTTAVNGFRVDGTTFSVDGANNRVGMGTAAPAEPFHVHKNSSAYNWVKITNSTTGSTTNDGLSIGLNSDEVGRIWHHESEDLIFGTDDTERMRIGADGDIGIGGTTGAKLHITQDGTGIGDGMRYTSGITTGQDWYTYMGLNDDFRIRNDLEDVLSIQNATNYVGVLTTAPTAELSVNGTANKPGGGSWAVFSDKRLKKNVKPFNDGLALIEKINPVWFQYNGKAGITTQQEYVGIIAQEMQQIAPYMVSTAYYNPPETTHAPTKAGKEQNPDALNSNQNNAGIAGEYLQFDPSALDFILINAIKEQQQIIKELQQEIELLKSNK